jgi:hypothetical protein
MTKPLVDGGVRAAKWAGLIVGARIQVTLPGGGLCQSNLADP